MQPEHRKIARLEARLPAPIFDLVRQAATLQGRTLSDFVVSAARDAATAALAQQSLLTLSAQEQKAFAERLLKPPAIKPALRRAAARHQQLIEPA